MLTRDRPRGTRFLAGLLAGGAVASGLLGLPAYLAGTALAALAPLPVREIAAGLAIAALGVADMADRTPHVWRQVPQSLVRTLPPGRLGLVWGFDLSLLVTTQKSTSLVWAALAGLVCLAPSHAALVLLGATAAGVAAIALRAATWNESQARCDVRRPWFVPMRRTTGAALLVLGMVTFWQGVIP
ncbi:hypothetical protein [Nonomuraea insulae]|uniref:Uncharacterized protein n=1 Tax=Nonomuraea insulae TaxID=1616787 RepID=A0ABW1CD34_9ACTN